MVAGIFLFDNLPLHKVDFWPVFVSWLVTVLLVLFLYSSGKSYKSVWFGLFTCLCSLMFGGVLTLSTYQKVNHIWSADEQLYEGVVQGDLVEKAKTYALEVGLRGVFSKDSDSASAMLPVDASVLLYLMKDSVAPDLSRGDTLLFYSAINQPYSNTDLMGFDYARYLLHRQISGTGVVFRNRWLLKGKSSAFNLKNYSLQIRNRIAQIYHDMGFGPDEEAVVKALTIGDKSDLTSELKAMYTVSGTSHILALSGMHIGILAGILFFILYPFTYLKNGRSARLILVALLLWGFAFITGLSPSVVRAVGMFSLFAIASIVIDERYATTHALTLTAFLMLVYNPYYLFDISFQLSFVAVFSILFFYPAVNGLLVPSNKILKYVWNVLSLSLVAQMGTLPIVLYNFGSFPTYFLVSNLIVAPLATVILVLSLLVLALLPFPFLQTTIAGVLNFFTVCLNETMSVIQNFNGAQVTSLYLTGLQSLLLAISLFALYILFEKRSARRYVGLLITVTLFLVSCIYSHYTDNGSYLYFNRSEIYRKQGHRVSKLSTDKGLVQVDSLFVGVMKDGCWSDKKTNRKLRLDYVYICRGFRGSLKELSELFDVKTVLFDGSLRPDLLEKLICECKLLKISYMQVSKQGSYKVML